MKTEFEITLKIRLTHQKENPHVDENSVKQSINNAIHVLSNCANYCTYGEGEDYPSRSDVKIIKLNKNGIAKPLNKFGTTDVQWNEE